MQAKDWKLTTLEIRNFKSIKNLKISPGRVNVFIGKPNAGKSNLLEALTLLGIDFSKVKTIPKIQIRYTDIASLFYDQNYDNVISIATQNYIWQVRQTTRISFNIGLYQFSDLNQVPPLNHNIDRLLYYDLLAGNIERKRIGNYVALTSKTDGKIINGTVIDVAMSGDIQGYNNIPTVKPIKKYQFHSPQDSNNSIEQLSINGHSLWSIIQHNSFLKTFASSFFKEFSLDTLYDVRNHKLDIMKKNEDSYYLIDFSMTPDTFQRMLYYLAVIEENKNGVILLEEPEAQSYPPYIQMLAEKIVDDEANQYFITTHSPFIVEKMLEHSGKDQDVKFFVTYFEDYQTKVHELTTKEIDSVISNGIDLFFNIEAFQK